MEVNIEIIIRQFGYWGIGALIAIENLFPPIPSEIVLAFAGFATVKYDMTVFGVIIASTIGSCAGALILYAIGRFLKPERLIKLFEGKIGKILHLKRDDVKRAEKWFSNHGSRAVFVCRFIPLVRSLVSIPAGAAGMKLHTFLPLTLIGTLIWNTVLILLGRAAGATWETVVKYFDLYSKIGVAIIMLIAGVILFIFIKNRLLNGRYLKESDGVTLDVEMYGNDYVVLSSVFGAEYRLGNGKWQDSSKFDELEGGKTYIFYARFLSKVDENDEEENVIILTKYTLKK
ncbi:MAG: DedA family protein [Christensenellaceae bacterium]|jgi:membrane protein DedA with SNARE-associated domain|nr:DedA family protein [Christensenellaceae bacterium]